MISIVKYLFESQAWERKSYDKSVVHGNSRPTMGNNFTHNFQKEKAEKATNYLAKQSLNPLSAGKIPKYTRPLGLRKGADKNDYTTTDIGSTVGARIAKKLDKTQY